jgi:hypothetical protein
MTSIQASTVQFPLILQLPNQIGIWKSAINIKHPSFRCTEFPIGFAFAAKAGVYSKKNGYFKFVRGQMK